MTAAKRRIIRVSRIIRAKSLGLTDCVSFEVMRQQNIRTAFAFDRHFAEQGFDLIPGP